jgi:hypothetical protein
MDRLGWEAVMVRFAAFAEISGAIIAAVGLALALEWFGVNGLLRLMPAPTHARPSDERR